MDFEQLYIKATEYVTNEQDEYVKQEVIQAMNAEDMEDLYDRFYTELAFGTAGMRGVIGGGFNRINPYMVRRVTQGLSEYLLEECKEDITVVIAYDSRNYSDTFAAAAAEVLCANGIRVYLYNSIHPVPLLSFAVRFLKASAGIVITASHNPPEYNGYKVYWNDGGQVIAPHDKGIVKKVQAMTSGEMIRTIDMEEARSKGLLMDVPQRVDEAYYDMVLSSIRSPEVFTQRVPCKVVYTPIHGSGNIPVQHLLRMLNVDYTIVKEQEQPNGDFPTVDLPNPENPKAMSLAMDLAKEVGADIVLGTDPDSDRLGIGIPVDDTKQEYTLLNGNQIAVLLCDYILSMRKDTGRKGVCVKSIVTTDLMKRISESYGVECRDVLTGFKYIADQMKRIEEQQEEFLFGAEESFGYLSVPHVYDKDAVSSAVLAVEMMMYYRLQGKSLLDRLEDIWLEYGFYREKVVSKTYPGADGREQMQQIMTEFRDSPPVEIGGMKVLQIEDLIKGHGNLPPANVLIITLDGGSKVIVRPSGTEPKIKYYFFSVSQGDDLVDSKERSLEKQQAMMVSLGLV